MLATAPNRELACTKCERRKVRCNIKRRDLIPKTCPERAAELDAVGLPAAPFRASEHMAEDPGLCPHAIGCRSRDAAARADFCRRSDAAPQNLRGRTGHHLFARHPARPGHIAAPTRSGHACGVRQCWSTRAPFHGAAPVEDSFTPGDVRFRSAGLHPFDGEHRHRPFPVASSSRGA